MAILCVSNLSRIKYTYRSLDSEAFDIPQWLRVVGCQPPRAARTNAAARSGLTSDNRSKEETAWGAAVLRSARRLWGFDGVCFDLPGHFGLSAVVKLHSSRQFLNRLVWRMRRVRMPMHQY